MSRKQGIAQRLGAMLGHQVVHALDVAQRLAHLGAAEVEHAVVQPEARERCAAVGALALRHFVLVVRELQVDTAGMDVDGLAQVGSGHRRALDVPARSAHAPRRVPARQVVAGRLPQDEVTGITLVRGYLDPGTGQHVLRITPRELAVTVKAGDREQHMAVSGIGMATFDQLLDHRDDVRDVRSGLGLDVRCLHAEGGHVFQVSGSKTLGDRADRHPGLTRGGVDLVIDVGDVACIAQRAKASAQQVGQHAEHHRAAGIADMHIVVDGRAADVHGGAGRVERGEGLGLA